MGESSTETDGIQRPARSQTLAEEPQIRDRGPGGYGVEADYAPESCVEEACEPCWVRDVLDGGEFAGVGFFLLGCGRRSFDDGFVECRLRVGIPEPGGGDDPFHVAMRERRGAADEGC